VPLHPLPGPFAPRRPPAKDRLIGQPALQVLGKRAYLDRIRSEFRSGASNAFFVRASDISEAIRGTFDVVVGGAAAEAPVRATEDAKRTAGLWLVAYLGLAGSSPPQWTVRSVEWRGTRLRLSYATGEARTRDMHPYFVWVPLGELKSGTYLLELFDAAENQATLIRRVKVPRD
jgi:hypothetical protein